MNQDIIAGRWKQLVGQATTGLGRITDSNWTILRGRVEQFFGELQERYGLERDRALAAIDECSSVGKPLDADQLAELNMDSDYGSGPRLGMDNLASTPVADAPPGLAALIAARLRHVGRSVRNQLRQHPRVSLMALTTVGFLAARWAAPLRRNP